MRYRRRGAKLAPTVADPPATIAARPAVANAGESGTIQSPTSLEIGAAGAPIGSSTAPDFEAKLEAETAVTSRAHPSRVAGRSSVWPRRPHLARRRIRRPRQRSRATPSVAEQPLLQDETFRRFWLARVTAQTAQGAFLYALLIVIVDRTDASFFNSLFVVCSIVPSLAFGLPAGIVVDALPRRPLLVGLNLLRCVFALSLVARDPSLGGIFAATLGMWTIHQFYSPSESTAIATLVPRRRYTSAQALSNLALTVAQLTGLVILAPLMLKTAGPRALFAVCAILFVVAAGFTARLPPLDDHVRGSASPGRARSLRGALLGGWRTARSDLVVSEVLADAVLVSIGMSSLVVIMPLYLKHVLGTGAENTVFVFAPAALGLVSGLRFAPRIGRAVEERRTATAGLIGFAICVASLGFIAPVHGFLTENLHLPLDQIAAMVRIPPLVIIAMLISIPAGFASALVSVSARAVLLDRTPAALRGQVIATETLLGNLGALGPTLLSGVAADLVGVEPIAIAIAALIAGGALLAHAATRPVAVPSAP